MLLTLNIIYIRNKYFYYLFIFNCTDGISARNRNPALLIFWYKTWLMAKPFLAGYHASDFSMATLDMTWWEYRVPEASQECPTTSKLTRCFCTLSNGDSRSLQSPFYIHFIIYRVSWTLNGVGIKLVTLDDKCIRESLNLIYDNVMYIFIYLLLLSSYTYVL